MDHGYDTLRTGGGTSGREAAVVITLRLAQRGVELETQLSTD